MVLFIKTHKATNKLNASRQPLAATRHLHFSSLIKVLLGARDVVVARGGSGLVVVAVMILTLSALSHRFLIVSSSLWIEWRSLVWLQVWVRQRQACPGRGFLRQARQAYLFIFWSDITAQSSCRSCSNKGRIFVEFSLNT